MKPTIPAASMKPKASAGARAGAWVLSVAAVLFGGSSAYFVLHEDSTSSPPYAQSTGAPAMKELGADSVAAEPWGESVGVAPPVAASEAQPAASEDRSAPKAGANAAAEERQPALAAHTANAANTPRTTRAAQPVAPAKPAVRESAREPARETARAKAKEPEAPSTTEPALRASPITLGALASRTPRAPAVDASAAGGADFTRTPARVSEISTPRTAPAPAASTPVPRVQAAAPESTVAPPPEKENPLVLNPPQRVVPVTAEPLVATPFTPKVVTATPERVWVQVDGTRTEIFQKGATVPGLGRFEGADESGPKFSR